MLALAAGGYAAAKSYQFTGVVKAVDSNSLTVEKSAKETWQFETDEGHQRHTEDRRIGHDFYKMVATEIEIEPDEVSDDRSRRSLVPPLHLPQRAPLPLVRRAGGVIAASKDAFHPAHFDFFGSRRRRQILVQLPRIGFRDVAVGERPHLSGAACARTAV